MKNVKLFLIAAATFFLLPLVSSAQDTTRVTNHYTNGQIYDTYLLNAAGEREGSFIHYNQSGKKGITGQYHNGTPIGIWEYYSADTSAVLVETLNFDTHTETYVDSNRVQSLICGPRYFGGAKLEKEYVTGREKKDFTDEEKKIYRGRTFIVSFTIDEKTFKPIGISIDDNSIPLSLKNKIIKIVSDMPAWLPPVCTDKSEVWRFSIAVLF